MSLVIPVDGAAEDALAAVAVASARGYNLAAARGVVGPNFYVPARRRLFEAAGDVGHLSGIDEDSLDERVRQVARLAGVELAEVRRLVEDRPVMWDKTGALAERVKRAAEARALMELCQDVFRRLGEGERVDVVRASLGPQMTSLLVGRSA